MKEYRKRFVQFNMLLIGLVLLIMMTVIAVYMYRDYYENLKNTMEQVVRPLDFLSDARPDFSHMDVHDVLSQSADSSDKNLQNNDQKNYEGLQDKTADSSANNLQNNDQKSDSGFQEKNTDSSSENFQTENLPADQSVAQNQPNALPQNVKNFPDDKPFFEQQKAVMTVFYTPASGSQEESISVLSQTDSFDEDVLSQLLSEVITQNKSFGVLSSYHAIYYYTGDQNLYRIALIPSSYITHSMISLLLVLALIFIGAMGCFLLVSIRLSKVAVRPMEEAMQREKQFVADASHDLKTPLSVILANNSILMENPSASVGSLSRWTDSTQAAAKKMQQLISEMLTLADVERKDTPLPIRPLDAASVVTKAALQLESVAYEKNVELDTEGIPEELSFSSNEDYLQRIASSLIENAIKYEPAGGAVKITLTREKKSVILSVHNKSSFISAEDLPHIFDRFYRADKSRQANSGGHGLGLAITKEMTERLGGRLSATSFPETGTCFQAVFQL